MSLLVVAGAGSGFASRWCPVSCFNHQEWNSTLINNNKLLKAVFSKGMRILFVFGCYSWPDHSFYLRSVLNCIYFSNPRDSRPGFVIHVHDSKMDLHCNMHSYIPYCFTMCFIWIQFLWLLNALGCPFDKRVWIWAMRAIDALCWDVDSYYRS